MNITVSVVLYKRESRKGFPVNLRVTHNRRSDYLSLKIYLSKDEFQKIIENDRLNPSQQIIRQKLLDAEHKANKLIYQMDVFSFDELKEQFTGKTAQKVSIRKQSIKSLFEIKIKALKREHKLQSAGTYSSCLSQIAKSNKEYTEVSKIDLKWINSFHQYLASSGKSNTTIIIYMKNLRAVWNIWNSTQNLISPFKQYEFPKAEINKRSINKEDLEKLLKFKGNKYFDLFKFSYYCGGMNIKDVLLLKRSNIQGDFINLKRSKTGVEIKLFLLPQAKEIISNLPINSAYLFNLIKNDRPDYLHERVKTIVKRVNLQLKKACEELEISKVTSYSARHSFATSLMNKGVDIVFISKTLGHSSIKTTQNYLGSFTDDQLQNNMKKLVNDKPFNNN